VANALFYTIEIRDSSDDLVSILENATDILYTEQLNKPPMLDFKIPSDDSKLDDIDRDHELWLRDYGTGTLICKFRLGRRNDTRTSTIETLIRTDGLITQLGEEVIEAFDTGEDGAAVGSIITTLLAFQRKATKVTEGTISVTGTRALNITNRTILSVLIQLQESIGGYMYVDSNRALQWATTIGADTGQQIRYRKNLLGINRDIDYSKLCTKLHLDGQEALSTIDVGPVSPTITTDATYAYFTLAETYSAYEGWSGVGDALPSHIAVWRENAAPAWVNSGGSCSGNYWDDPDEGSDGSTTGYALYVGPSGFGLQGGQSSVPLTCVIPSATYNNIKYDLRYSTNALATIKLEVYDTTDGWVTVFDGNPGTNDTYHEKSFPARICTSMRITGHSGWPSDNYATFYVTEMQIEEADEVDVTSDFVQGAWENILRAAIADYDSGESYTIEYTHANYMVAWDEITDADDLVSRVVTNKYEAYALSIQESSELILDEVKTAPISYTIQAVDLSKNDDFDFSFDALTLGSTVTVIDEDLGIDVSVRIISIIHNNLLDPQDIEIVLSTRVKDITDYLADLPKQFG